MSIPYELSGRREQKQRTKAALVTAARALVGEGATPTVELAAERAGISRTTAYRYFPNRRALLVEAHPETAATTLLPDDAPADPAERLDLVVEAYTQLLLDNEPQQRTTLRVSMELTPEERATLPLRQGRVIGWVAEALEPLRGQLTDEQVQRLSMAVRSATGVEALVWLTDIAGLSREDAREMMRWSAQAMLRTALVGEPPPAKARHGKR